MNGSLGPANARQHSLTEKQLGPLGIVVDGAVTFGGLGSLAPDCYAYLVLSPAGAGLMCHWCRNQNILEKISKIRPGGRIFEKLDRAQHDNEHSFDEK